MKLREIPIDLNIQEHQRIMDLECSLVYIFSSSAQTRKIVKARSYKCHFNTFA